MDDKYIRQQELVNQEKLANLHVTIIGCGAVGSFTALSLCKMGVGQLTLIDNDKVSIENLPNQFFREDDIGEKKVAACMEILKDFIPIIGEKGISRLSPKRPACPSRTWKSLTKAILKGLQTYALIWSCEET